MALVKGHEDCGVSTFIDDETLTFGHGQLDHNGSWEHPCLECALAFLKHNPTAIVFPSTKEDLSNNPYMPGIW
jgi:hypothetical protein